jgi:glycosyltransferase involved in cell wall biosynthesis
MIKVALFYDWLNQWGGAEKVLLDLIKLYPEAPVYTLVHDPQKTNWLPVHTKIITSFINSLPHASSNPLLYTPLYDLALEQFDFSKFDIVISTTSTIGHCLLTPSSTLFACYFHNINRYLYQTPRHYQLLKPLLSVYKKIDLIYSKRPDFILCNSQTVNKRIKKHYLLDAKVINPGIDLDFFKPISHPGNSYFLIVSRLVPHKNTEIVIRTFNGSPHNLKIIGSGRHLKFLQDISHDSPNIKFLGQVSDHQLLEEYQNCRALICPQLEDFGLTPIEAQACGKPVIALGRGGNTETIVNGKTGVFFKYPSPASLTPALKKFTSMTFDPLVCRQNATRFSSLTFMLNFKQAIDNIWQEHLTTTS